MANTACFIIVARNDIPIYEAEVGSAAKVHFFLLCISFICSTAFIHLLNLGNESESLEFCSTCSCLGSECLTWESKFHNILLWNWHRTTEEVQRLFSFLGMEIYSITNVIVIVISFSWWFEKGGAIILCFKIFFGTVLHLAWPSKEAMFLLDQKLLTPFYLCSNHDSNWWVVSLINSQISLWHHSFYLGREKMLLSCTSLYYMQP